MSLPLSSVVPLIGAVSHAQGILDVPDISAIAEGQIFLGTAGTEAVFFLNDDGEIGVDASLQDGSIYYSNSVSASITAPDHPLRWFAPGGRINPGDYTFHVINRINVQRVEGGNDEGRALSVFSDIGRATPVTCSFTVRISLDNETVTEFDVAFTSISTHYSIIT